MPEEVYPVRPVLLVDDEQPWLRSLSLTLREALGFNHIIKCHDSREVMPLLQSTSVSLVLLDLTMPHLSGQDLLQLITKEFPEIPVIILSGLNQLETAVQCMQLGAFDYYVKTVETERLTHAIQRALATQEMHDENLRLKSLLLEDSLEHPEAFANIVTRSKKMRAVFQYCEAVANSSEPILIFGESGVGKELIARAVHKIRCQDQPWVAINVAGLDDNVFSDTLFGHTKGAYTGADRERRGMIEEAAGGTLFLDEVGDLNLSSQIKLLRLLQEGEYFPIGSDKPRRLKAKLIFATNSELACKSASGEFRKDLYYRLSAHQVRIPALRERIDDLEVLIPKFVHDAAAAFDKDIPVIPREIFSLLTGYSFPGNVRELRAMIFNAVSMARSGCIPADCLREKLGMIAQNVQPGHESAASPCQNLQGGTTQQMIFPERLPNLEELGQQIVSEAMRRANGNQTIAASMLGITRQGLAKRLKKIDTEL